MKKKYVYLIISDGSCVYVCSNKDESIYRAEHTWYDYVEQWEIGGRYMGRIWTNEENGTDEN
jgi:hypothetical protein